MARLIALDLGFGNTKATDGQSSVIFPSFVSVPTDIGLAGMGLKKAQKTQRIVFEGGDFYVGEGAPACGRILENMDFYRLASPEALSLLYAALASLKVEGEIKLVLGLPVPLLRNEEVARALLNALKTSLVREHRFRVDGKELHCDIVAVKVLAQPAGAWANWALDEQGNWISAAARTALVGIVDCGLNTLDLYGVRGGAIEPRLVGGDRVGVRRILDLAAPNLPYYHSDALLRQGTLRISGVIDTWFSEVLGVIERTWGRGLGISVVLLVGGGANYLQAFLTQLRRVLETDVVVPPNPIFANAMGLWKWGLTAKWHEEKGRATEIS